MFASNRLYTDWKVAKPEKNVQKNLDGTLLLM